MKTVTNEFKEQITKLGREIDFKFFLYTNDKIITEDGKFLMTENNKHLVVQQFDEEEIDETINAEDIYNVSIVNRGNLLSTMMKELDFEISKDLRIGDIIECEFGLKVGEDYEYINYGKYMVYSKEFNEDTKTYNYIAYDRMLLTMQEASSEFLSNLEGETIADCIHTICETVGLSFVATQQELEDYPNLNKEINEGTFTDLQITYRDILDMICQALGLSMIIEEKQLILKSLNNTIVDEFDETYLKDTNVSFGEKYMINSVVLSRSEDTDSIYRRDEESIIKNGVHEFKIKDNLIMLYDDREDYIDEIFEQLNGLEYYVNDFSSTGITYLDWLDFYNVKVGNKTYKCLMLNDEIKINQGLEETIYTEEPEETVTNYKTSSKTDKEVSFIVDKQNGKIRSQVSKDDIIASLNVAIEDGQGVVELKGNTVTIDSDNFKLTAEGEIDATAGDIGGFMLGEKSFTASLISDKLSRYTYDNSDVQRVMEISVGNITPTSSDYDKYDFNYDGRIDGRDTVLVLYASQGTLNGNGVFTLDTKNSEKAITLKDTNDKEVLNLGLFGSFIEYLNTNHINSTDGYETKGSIVLTRDNPDIWIGYLGSTSVGGQGTSMFSLSDQSGQMTIEMFGYNGHIDCVSLTQTSLEEKKKNFEKLKSGLDIIKNIDIYKYNMDVENDDEKKHIGFVIGDNFKYSQEITSNENNGVDIYSFVSVCCKAIQEQQEQINSLKQEIKELKESDK